MQRGAKTHTKTHTQTHTDVQQIYREKERKSIQELDINDNKMTGRCPSFSKNIKVYRTKNVTIIQDTIDTQRAKYHSSTKNSRRSQRKASYIKDITIIEEDYEQNEK